jgi:hypothetical protein
MSRLRTHLPTFLALFALLALAGWLRWRYASEISLYVDEFTTLWAASRVMANGVPIMPSGVLYTRGLLATYVTALAGALAGGLSYSAGRLPSLLFGLAAIAAIFAVGRREWNSRVAGWLRWAWCCYLKPSSGARVPVSMPSCSSSRCSPSGPPTLPSSTGRKPCRKQAAALPSARRHLLFAALFVLALFSQEQMVLLYPSILLATLLWRGWRYLLRPQVWPAHAVCLAAMGVRFGIEILGQPGYFETIQAERPYVGLILDLPAAWSAYAELLVSLERLPWTIFGLLALVVAVFAWGKQRGRMAQVVAFHQATLFFALQFIFMLALCCFSSAASGARHGTCFSCSRRGS